MFEYTIKFFKFLHKCNRYHIRLRSVKVYDENICFHFAKQYFYGNNTYYFDDDHYFSFNTLCFDNERDLYDTLISEIYKVYNIKED